MLHQVTTSLLAVLHKYWLRIYFYGVSPPVLLDCFCRLFFILSMSEYQKLLPYTWLSIYRCLLMSDTVKTMCCVSLESMAWAQSYIKDERIRFSATFTHGKIRDITKKFKSSKVPRDRDGREAEQAVINTRKKEKQKTSWNTQYLEKKTHEMTLTGRNIKHWSDHSWNFKITHSVQKQSVSIGTS